ncbi:MAG: tetratricopeptide repeat protein [Chloroflexaceae bacterium]|nr:tetratricopeptide repeat protein [Chloroflexaceae bacterium]
MTEVIAVSTATTFSCAFLDAYLDADLREHLEREGSLPPDARAALAAHLRRTLTACVAYIPGRLVARQMADPLPGRISGSFWYGSLLFADLSGFTSLSEKLSVLGKQGAEEVSGVVNQLFEALVAEVLTHQGVLLKFGGDALTAFFDTESLGPLHAMAATHAALAMQERMAAFAELKTRRGTFRLQLRVGVHSGKVFAAEVGDPNHIELVVTGPEVNRVATAQEIAAPGEVVISDYTANLLEGAILTPRKAGFHRITSLPAISLPPPEPNPIALDGPDDLETLEQLAHRVEALRPYLVRNLPRRFLDPTVFEMGEFRPVTVLFANFHNFSALLTCAGEDAAFAASVLNAYFRRAQAVVHRYDGIVNKVDMYTHGDKLMALFGAPNVHEDDPLRAVRCALELDEALQGANTEIATLLEEAGDENSPTSLLHQRVGLNTGTVFAGRVGGFQRYEYTVMGSAVNLAARLMAATDDGTVLLSPATRKAVERQVAVADQPPLKLKGLTAPVIPARALSMLDVERGPRRSADTSVGHSPFIGRDTVLVLLTDRAKAALQGAGHTLALVGEAGIGKTRLAEELTRNLIVASFSRDASETIPSFQIYSGDCQSYEQTMPYAAIRAPLRHLLRLNPNGRGNPRSAGATWLNQIETRAGQLAPSLHRFTPLLGDALGVTLPDTPLTSALSNEQRHNRLQELLVALFLGAAHQEPLLLSLEDIQWADASSLELLSRLTQSLPRTPLLLFLNYRPDPPIDEPWGTLPTTTRLELDELTTEDSIELLAAMLNGPPPPEVLPLLERTQGNPYFIEELVRSLITSEVLARGEAGMWVVTRPLDQVAVPTSIEGLIFARLDRLDEPRHGLVQVASVIGRRFQRAVLEEVDSTLTPIDDKLLSLIDDEIIVTEEAVQMLQSYLFRHALLRDVAYEGILYARRRDLHRRVAQQIERLNFGHLDDSLTLLAYHYRLAEVWELAFFYHKQAGVSAQRRYANREALTLFATALDITQHLASDAQEASAALCFIEPIPVLVAELHERRSYICALLGESDEARTGYLEALRLVNQMRADDTCGLPSVTEPQRTRLQVQLDATTVRLHRHLATLCEQQTSYDQAFEWLERGMEQATPETHTELARCYLLGARISYIQGKFAESLDWAQTGLSIAEYLDNLVDQAQALVRIGVIWSEQNEPAKGVPALEKACKLFEQANHLSGLNQAFNNLGIVCYRLGRLREAINYYGQCLQISENIGDVITMARASNNLALALVERGHLERASELYQYSSEQFRRIGSEQGVANTMLNRGEVLLLQGQPAEAMDLFRESIAILERINVRIDLPEGLRLAAEASLELDEMDQARDYATARGMIALELGMALEEALARQVLGQIALSQHAFSRASDELEQSRAALEQLENRSKLGKVLYWQARLAQAQGHTDQVRPMLQQAQEIFQEFHAQRDLQRLREFLAELDPAGPVARSAWHGAASEPSERKGKD